VLALIVVGYLVGSIPFAYLLARRCAGVDVRLAGSGNVGATNVFRTTRASLGIAAMALDIAKGYVVVAWVSRGQGDAAALAAAGTATIVGHIYPVWLRFHGGKGVATACGVFAVLAPVATVIAIAVFAIVASITRYVSLGSVAGIALVPPLALMTGKPRPFVWAALATAVLIIFRHRSNLARLFAGTERPLWSARRFRRARRG
jgi:glycerol-3-phosphate acyltransferase PlsY